MTNDMTGSRSGPLSGCRVVEIAGIGPTPFCGMMLADMGAEILRVESPHPLSGHPNYDRSKDVLLRGRGSITLDLKRPEAVNAVLALAAKADVLLEGYRPGVMERLGLGPEVCFASNRRLVYARMTGWGQGGPLAHKAGHDINYFALSGSLHMCGRADERPSPNLNFVADMGGGGMLMAFGIACALFEAGRSGQGQVIDAAMVDGSALLAAQIHGLRAMGWWSDRRGSNLLDCGAPYYDVYETSDGGFMALGALEDKFYANLLEGLGFDPVELPDRGDPTHWAALRECFAERFRSRTRSEWVEIFDRIDACATPVLTPDEAACHSHMVARQSFGTLDGVQQPMPAPRFSRTPGAVAGAPPVDDSNGWRMARNWGLSDPQIEMLRANG
jgi:alpha-methylacyl-CoA racemase